MPDNLFRESLHRLPLGQKFIISEICRKQPEIFSYLEELFYKKFEAMKKNDKTLIENISNEEKEKVSRILNGIIKEN